MVTCNLPTCSVHNVVFLFFIHFQSNVEELLVKLGLPTRRVVNGNATYFMGLGENDELVTLALVQVFKLEAGKTDVCF